MRANLNENEDVDVQMTPLIDCVFLLLVFFLVATTLKKTELEVPLELPVANYTARQVPVSSEMLTISINPKGEILLGAKAVTPGILQDEIKQRAAQDSKQPVRVNADRNAPWWSVLQVLELLKFEEMTNVRPGTADAKH